MTSVRHLSWVCVTPRQQESCKRASQQPRLLLEPLVTLQDHGNASSRHPLWDLPRATGNRPLAIIATRPQPQGSWKTIGTGTKAHDAIIKGQPSAAADSPNTPSAPPWVKKAPPWLGSPASSGQWEAAQQVPRSPAAPGRSDGPRAGLLWRKSVSSCPSWLTQDGVGGRSVRRGPVCVRRCWACRSWCWVSLQSATCHVTRD